MGNSARDVRRGADGYFVAGIVKQTVEGDLSIDEVIAILEYDHLTIFNAEFLRVGFLCPICNLPFHFPQSRGEIVAVCFMVFMKITNLFLFYSSQFVWFIF